MRLETIDVVSVELSAIDAGPMPAFRPGDHIDVWMPNRIIRQYSLCNEPTERGSSYLIAVKREPASRGGSAFIHHSLRVGDAIEIGSPRSNFDLVDGDSPILFIAAGIGITPMTPMVAALRRTGRSHRLEYFCRSAEHVVFPAHWEADPIRSHIHSGLDRATINARTAAVLGTWPRDGHVYICGPTSFMDDVAASARATGFPQDAIHLERFTPAERPTSDSRSGSSSVTVRAARSNLDVAIEPGESIAAAMLKAGIDVPLSCEQGICGSCVTRVLAGVPDHHDDYLTDEEKDSCDQMCVCVSGAQTPELVLDI